MKTIKEIDEQENSKMKKENQFIDNWLNKHFGISNQKEAREKAIFIFFYNYANFVKIITTDYGNNFHFISPVEDEYTMEHWLKSNKLYAHRASSFCGRNRDWYDLSFKEQLESLCWEFDKNGKLKNTKW